MTKRRLIFLVIAIVVLGGIFIAWQRFGGQAMFAGSNSAASRQTATNQAVPVTIGAVRQADFPVNVIGLGQAQAYNNVTIHSQVDGQIQQVLFKEGETVKQGDLLVQIDPAAYQAMVDQANGKLAEDQANLQNANLDLQRFSTLAKNDFASAQQLDTQQALVRQDTALVQADQAAVSTAKIQLSYTQIHAPIAGRIGFRLVDVGSIVHASDSNGLLSITQVQPIFVAFSAPGDQVDRINKALQAGPVTVTALSDDGQRKLGDGTLSVINNQIDTSTATIQLKATFDNADNSLWPGLSVQTRMLVETLKNVVVVPVDAVQRGPNGLFVYVVNDNKASLRPIEVGDTGGGVSVVTKGLTAGEQVVTAGQYRLEDGTPVTTTEVAANNTPGPQQ